MSSTNDNLDHLRRIIERRDRLTDAAEETFLALLEAIRRERPGPDRILELWEAVRVLKVKSAATRLAEAADVPLTTIHNWKRWGLPSSGRVLSGHFPMEAGAVPPRWVGVYVLFAGEQAVYIGQSRNVKQRLKAHWRDPEKRASGIERWWVMTCEPADLSRVESDLIFEHQPLLNKIGKVRAA